MNEKLIIEKSELVTPPGTATLTPVMSSIWTSSFRRRTSPTRVASPSRTFHSPSTRMAGRADPSRGQLPTTTRPPNRSTSGCLLFLSLFAPKANSDHTYRVLRKLISFQNPRLRRPQSLRLREHLRGDH